MQFRIKRYAAHLLSTLKLKVLFGILSSLLFIDDGSWSFCEK